MRDKTGDKARLLHIYEAILELESYLKEKDFTDFKANSMLRFACIKQLEIIGEAGNHVTEEIKSNFQEIAWPQIVSMRNVFVHQAFNYAHSGRYDQTAWCQKTPQYIQDEYYT